MGKTSKNVLPKTLITDDLLQGSFESKEDRDLFVESNNIMSVSRQMVVDKVLNDTNDNHELKKSIEDVFADDVVEDRNSKQISNYVLDTNILISDPKSLINFKNNNIYIPYTVLNELDKIKAEKSERGRNARKSLNLIEAFQADIGKEYGKLPRGGKLYLLKESKYNVNKSPDENIIEEIKAFFKDISDLTLVTNDTGMRIKASLSKINSEIYRNGKIPEEVTSLYSEIDVSNLSFNLVDYLYRNKSISIFDFTDEDNEALNHLFYSNEFLVLKYLNNSALAIYRNNTIELIDKSKLTPYGVKAKNAAQTFALYALLAPAEEIPLVILRGKAGTAKTFLSLAAGLDQVFDERKMFNKVLITRNNITSDEQFGYLPGSLEEKMEPLLAPFYDNLEAIIRGKGNEMNDEIAVQIEDLFASGAIQVAPLAYMRGRSISNSFLICDEMQNSTITQIKDIVTRTGEGTKIVVCGDPSQIDNPILNKRNNGLTYISEKMKDSPLCAQINFSEKDCVRSKLAAEALRLMN